MRVCECMRVCGLESEIPAGPETNPDLWDIDKFDRLHSLNLLQVHWIILRVRITQGRVMRPTRDTITQQHEADIVRGFYFKLTFQQTHTKQLQTQRDLKKNFSVQVQSRKCMVSRKYQEVSMDTQEKNSHVAPTLVCSMFLASKFSCVVLKDRSPPLVYLSARFNLSVRAKKNPHKLVENFSRCVPV